ncbi:hypothetical protein HUW62_12720 [Myxococcus sp. AM011]|nr:hypothetical protein [Myxococcus sp. AM011]NVJ22081.1 hypothetical protein [Myxococcus sp. AM011]
MKPARQLQGWHWRRREDGTTDTKDGVSVRDLRPFAALLSRPDLAHELDG